jgi:hypothetical protein
MEIKKIVILLIVVFIPFSLFLFSDISQYKQIGNTHFYLLPNEMGIESFLYHDGGEEGIFYPINHKGTVHDIYWNQQYIIIKCSEQKEENWYLMRNIKDYNYPKFMIQHFLNENDYKRVLDSLGISETNMEYTDGTIPWSLHLK